MKNIGICPIVILLRTYRVNRQLLSNFKGTVGVIVNYFVFMRRAYSAMSTS